jgi:uncharacterized protein (TIGR02246 family)
LGLLAVTSLTSALGGRCALAEDSHAEDRASIEKNGQAFVDAFGRGDAKAVAAFWTSDGDYTDETGRRLRGRDAIEKAFERFFSENHGLRTKIEGFSIRFITPGVAVEEGTSEVFAADGPPPSQARYTAVHVKKDGQWLLASVTEAPYTPPSHYRRLQGLEWTIGDWAGQGDNGQGEQLSFNWAEDQNFIVASFTTVVKDVPVGNATQWIGWDPEAKRLRSWIFDATGGFGEGSLSQDGNKWTIKTKTVLRDGKKATATYVLGRVDADTITLQSTDRMVDGKPLPDTKEIQLKRVK